MQFFSLFFVHFFKNRLYLIIYSRVYMRKNLHISKKNLNFARFFSGKLPNRFSKILIIVYIVKSGLQKWSLDRNPWYVQNLHNPRNQTVTDCRQLKLTAVDGKKKSVRFVESVGELVQKPERVGKSKIRPVTGSRAGYMLSCRTL